MANGELVKSILKTVTEWMIRNIVVLLLSGFTGLVTICLPIKSHLVKHPNVFLVLLATMVAITVLCLILLIRMYRRYGRFQEAFGVFWDRKYNMRCLACKEPLKHSSTSPSMFYCSDPKCNSKYVLRDTDGIEMTQQNAITHLMQDVI